MSAKQAAEIGRVRNVVADKVTETFLSHHPDWIQRYGDRARIRGVEDARHHIDFLQAAVDLDEPEEFADYALWCAEVLESRGIAEVFLIENLEAIREELRGRISHSAQMAVASAISAGLDALTELVDLSTSGITPPPVPA